MSSAISNLPNNEWWQRAFGNRATFYESSLVALSMLLVTVLYEYISLQFSEFPLHWGEFLGTWTGLTCVWLTRKQNIHCWPWGIASVLFLGWFFGDIGLPGQQWLNWGFFLAIQLWAWPHWVWGGKNRSELPVSTLSWIGRVVMITSVLVGTVLVLTAIEQFAPGSRYPILDALVVAASVVAQFLLGRKKVESWFLWLGPVNVVSIILFTLAGAYVLTALYVAFLIHAGFAIKSWFNQVE